MKTTTAIWLAAGVVAFAQAPSSDAAPRRNRAARRVLATQALTSGAPFTITYDTGMAVEFPQNTTGFEVVGNRFNTIMGGPILGPVNLTRVTLFPQNSGPQSFSFALPPNSMGSAMVLTYQAATFTAMEFNVVQLSPAVALPTDFIVTFIGDYGNPGGLLALDDMSNAAQGFHAIRGTYSNPSLLGVTPIPNRNALLRVTGPGLPVELLDFKLE
jgi:hypothetical protein